MKLDHLNEFISLAEIGEISKTAKELKIAQSTLSKHIMQLELSLGVPLLNRSSKGISLNNYGKIFLPYAKSIMDEQDSFMRQLARVSGNKSDSVSIGFIYSVMLFGGMDVFNLFRKSFPNIRLSLQEALSKELKPALDSGEFDFVFFNEFGEPDETDHYSRLPILTDIMVAAVPSSHPLAQRDYVTLKDLVNEPFVMWPKYSLCYRILMPAFAELGLTPNIITFSPNSQHIQDFISDEIGISILLKRRASCQRNENVTFVDLYPPMRVNLNMLYKESALSPMARQFLEFMQLNAHNFN